MQDTVVETTSLILQLQDTFVLAFMGLRSRSERQCRLGEEGLTNHLQLLQNFFLEDLQIGSLFLSHYIVAQVPLSSKANKDYSGLFCISTKIIININPYYPLLQPTSSSQYFIHHYIYHPFPDLSIFITTPHILYYSMSMRGYSSFNVTEQNLPDQIIWNPAANTQEHKKSTNKIDLTEVFKAHQCFSQTDLIEDTALLHSPTLSNDYEAEIFLKREDHQRGRTFKIRGAYYQYLQSDEQRRKEGYVIVSDGNFAASYSIIAGLFKTKCVIFVPQTCYRHKLQAIKREGKEYVEIIQVGMDFEECTAKAVEYAKEKGLPMLKSFETPTLLTGFATIAKEIVQAEKKRVIDYILVPAGGGGLASSMASVIKQISPQTKIIAVEPDICKPYSTSILLDQLIIAQKVSKFCNGSSVKQTSQLAYDIGRTAVDGFVEVTEKKLAEKIIKLYSMGFICQPSGALSIAGLDKIRNLIKGKTVVCVLSGANIDLTKLDEARQIAAISKGIKNHYHFTLPNKRNVIYDLITKCFKPTDIISIQYSQHIGKESSQALLSVESQTQDDVQTYIEKLVEGKYNFENINEKEDLLGIFF